MLASLIALGGLGGTIAAEPPARAELKDTLIRQFCLLAMQEEFQASGKTPPSGMLQSTCDCVVQQFNADGDLEKAKDTCRRQARKRYGV
jgi:hypothetical protein